MGGLPCHQDLACGKRPEEDPLLPVIVTRLPSRSMSYRSIPDSSVATS